MNSAIGVVELRSISKGYETADHMLKTSPVFVHHMKPICPGKFLIIMSGDTADVEEAMNAAKTAAGEFRISDFTLHGVHPDLVDGLKKRYSPQPVDAIGIVETSTVSSGMYALNEALKQCNIYVKRMNLGMAIGGKFLAAFTGRVSDVEQGMKMFVSSMDEKRIVHHTVLRSPAEEMKQHFK
ncbi:MAG: BMC domain-containing protein [Paenibacillus sp.]|uniref:PduT-like ethanolamine utilization protein n=1 Tax=Paenibacillus aquistagni TaxID=1852522 RepID=A0A1X7LPR6_9BACL|nr:BMC domain-containing protein [Paenibacillus aquistagni]MBR2568091.1 BMC domain-containing protein [Paenibacillus sp.]NMM53309.1 BMC domain-containing protein [Paenibacillus aquistagni]SMG55680.1 PduT-like ethanolamine utilization protein [Paenibacillus aquistagni]